MAMDFDTLLAVHGPVTHQQLDEDLEQHLLHRGYYPKHKVKFSKLLKVHSRQPRYVENAGGKRAPLIMVGPTESRSFLCMPIEPIGRWGVLAAGNCL